jgi:hypothetical protein
LPNFGIAEVGSERQIKAGDCKKEETEEDLLCLCTDSAISLSFQRSPLWPGFFEAQLCNPFV